MGIPSETVVLQVMKMRGFAKSFKSMMKEK